MEPTKVSSKDGREVVWGCLSGVGRGAEESVMIRRAVDSRPSKLELVYMKPCGMGDLGRRPVQQLQEKHRGG